LQPDPKSKYTLIFKTTNTEPGFNIGFMRHNAEISGVAWIVETANKSHVIAKISVINAPGGSCFENDYATDERISTAYSSGQRLDTLLRETVTGRKFKERSTWSISFVSNSVRSLCHPPWSSQVICPTGIVGG
jgi:hypothetical protein